MSEYAAGAGVFLLVMGTNRKSLCVNVSEERKCMTWDYDIEPTREAINEWADRQYDDLVRWRGDAEPILINALADVCDSLHAQLQAMESSK